MKRLVIIIICMLLSVLVLSCCGQDNNNSSQLPPLECDFSDCKVEVLEYGKSVGELNKEDTEYFVSIMNAIELGKTVEDYQVADGESTKEYLITLSNGQKIYFGQGFGEAAGYEGACFVHINDKVYTVTNPAVLNALYVIKENFYFYNR